MSQNIPIAVAEGDGIGPEIMAVVLEVLKEAGAPLEIHKIEIGEKMYLKGEPTGISASTWEIIRKTKAFLKAPITTPQGGGFKSLNVTVRTTLGLYANVRPCISYSPFITTKHPKMDLHIIRENEEDLYTGIEYRQTPETVQALKIITRSGCERIIRYAFEYARANHRKKVTCFTKDNILKLSDGLFHKIYEEIAAEYPDIQNEHWIIDIGAAKMADTPEVFDVIVLPNLYGDILSDVAAQISGSVGIAGSANIGLHGAMFEAIHGSAPRRAGQDLANPSGLLLAAVMMLSYLGQSPVATLIHNAWLKTIEEGIHTYDIFKEATSRERVGTRDFGKAVIARLGKMPEHLKPAHYENTPAITMISNRLQEERNKKRSIAGADFFIESSEPLQNLLQKLQSVSSNKSDLSLIANRGTIVWPQGAAETFCSDTWRCRFLKKSDLKSLSYVEVAQLMTALVDAGLGVVQMQLLCDWDDEPGYSGTNRKN